jgi:hypothetical protein
VVSADQRLTVAVTGPTGTFGFGLIPLLQAGGRVMRIAGAPVGQRRRHAERLPGRGAGRRAPVRLRLLGGGLRVPALPPAAQWVEAASHPAIMDITKAKRDLGWTPRFTALEALRDTLR